MHDTAMEFGKLFFDTYVIGTKRLKIVDVGSFDVNGSLRSAAPVHCEYIGVDFEAGKGVDVVIKDPYSFPFDSDTIDIVVCASCFEHAEFFWLVFNEIQRILKPTGVAYINAPSNGCFHRFPVDCWRFYPDSGVALQNWARLSKYKTTMLESFIGLRRSHQWNDFVAVFAKDGDLAEMHADRMINKTDHFTNGLKLENGRLGEFINHRNLAEDQEISEKLRIEMTKLRSSLRWKLNKPIRSLSKKIKKFTDSVRRPELTR
jgi:SAM-dependent methyltransferase